MLTAEYNDQVLHLIGDLQVHHLESVKSELVAWATDGNPLTLDVSQVQEIDLAGLQMVLAFLRSRKTGIKVTGIGAELAKALALAGLTPHFATFLD